VARITAFATANRVSIPVDEAYPFFVRSGLLVCGGGDAEDLASAFAQAIAQAAAFEGVRRPLRTLMHIDTPPGAARRSRARRTPAHRSGGRRRAVADGVDVGARTTRSKARPGTSRSIHGVTPSREEPFLANAADVA